MVQLQFTTQVVAEVVEEMLQDHTHKVPQVDKVVVVLEEIQIHMALDQLLRDKVKPTKVVAEVVELHLEEQLTKVEKVSS